MEDFGLSLNIRDWLIYNSYKYTGLITRKCTEIYIYIYTKKEFIAIPNDTILGMKYCTIIDNSHIYNKDIHSHLTLNIVIKSYNLNTLSAVKEEGRI